MQFLYTFSANEWMLVVMMFVWSGFIRSGLGFGGVALALPLMLLLRPDPLFWLPILALHLLIFSFATVVRNLSNIDWSYLIKSMKIMIIPKILGVLGLVILPPTVLVLIVYLIIFAFALSYIFNYVFRGKSPWMERFFLILGGYVSGTSLIGAPLIVAAYSQHVPKNQLRDTLFVLWFILVCIKIASLVVLKVPLQWQFSLLLLPAAGLGHIIGLRVHQFLVQGDDVQFKRYLGVSLALISLIGLWGVLFQSP
ncbi:MAG: TSUP family transporter [Arenicellales bacterium]